jgi:SAM-dependent methyltransferase
MENQNSSYIGRHAALYDLFYADKPYSDEAAFIHKNIKTFKPHTSKVLELACGTGSHSLCLEKYGYDITATDYSADMLAFAEKKALELQSKITFLKQDMRDLNLVKGPFDAIICLFDSLGYLITNENIIKVLKSINNLLTPDGLFIFEFWHAGAMLKSYDPVRVRHFPQLTGEIVRISETLLDYEEQVCHVTYTINELYFDGTFQSIQETQINRFFLVQEMRFFLEQAELIPVKWFSGFHDDEKIDENTWHIIAVARKKSRP